MELIQTQLRPYSSHKPLTHICIFIKVVHKLSEFIIGGISGSIFKIPFVLQQTTHPQSLLESYTFLHLYNDQVSVLFSSCYFCFCEIQTLIHLIARQILLPPYHKEVK